MDRSIQFIAYFSFFLTPLFLAGGPAYASAPKQFKSAPSSGGKGLADEARLVRDAAKAFLEVMSRCPERMWPGYSWTGLDVVIVREGQTKQTRVSLVSRKIDHIADQDVPESAKEGQFSFYESNGRAVMSLNATQIINEVLGVPEDDESGMRCEGEAACHELALDSLFGLGIHEAFHVLVQDGSERWPETKGARGTHYPINVKPRLLRRNLFFRMKEAFLSGGSGPELGQAAFWNQQWHEAFPKEVNSSLDAFEGTARYVEAVANFLRLRGCQAGEAELKKDADELISAKSNFGNSVDGSTLNLDAEGYELGAMAAFLLRFKLGNKNWTAEMRQGASPIEVLLRNERAIADQTPPGVEDLFEKTRAELQKTADEEVGWALKLMQSGGVVFIGYSKDWQGGSSSPKESYIFGDLGMALTAMAEPLKITSPHGNGQLSAGEGAIDMSPDGESSSMNYCKSDLYFLVAADSVKEENGWLIVDDPRVNGRVRARIEAKGNYRWACPK